MRKKTVLCIILLTALIPTLAWSAQISFFLGSVSMDRKGKAVKVSMGLPLQNGDMLKTGKDGVVEVSYADGSKIKIKENSSAQIGSKGISGSDNVSLVSGNLAASFSKIVKGGGKKTYSPTVVCAVRGTEYTMTVSKDGETRIDLDKGNVSLNNPFGELTLKEGENAESDISKAPGKNIEGSSQEWASEKDAAFDKNPADKGDDYNSYFQKLDESSKETSGTLPKLNETVAKEKDKEKLIHEGKELQKISDKAEDDMILNETARGSIDQLMNNYKSTEKNLYDMFLKIKHESNKVMEQQMKNYKALEEVKEAYKKAYDKIMGTYHDDFNKIINGTDFKKVLPNMQDFNE